jgi:hypothetical protein
MSPQGRGSVAEIFGVLHLGKLRLLHGGPADAELKLGLHG